LGQPSLRRADRIIGQFGRPDSGVLEKVAGLMAAQLGWNQEKQLREIASLDPIYRTAA